jgi:hypothetical protein
VADDEVLVHRRMTDIGVHETGFREHLDELGRGAVHPVGLDLHGQVHDRCRQRAVLAGSRL